MTRFSGSAAAGARQLALFASGTAAAGGASHTLTYRLTEHDGHTDLALTQDDNSTQEEADHSAKHWSMMLAGLKRVVESS